MSSASLGDGLMVKKPYRSAKSKGCQVKGEHFFLCSDNNPYHLRSFVTIDFLATLYEYYYRMMSAINFDDHQKVTSSKRAKKSTVTPGVFMCSLIYEKLKRAKKL